MKNILKNASIFELIQTREELHKLKYVTISDLSFELYNELNKLIKQEIDERNKTI